MHWLYSESKLWWFLFLSGTTIVFLWLQQTFFMTDLLYYNTYSDQLSLDTIQVLIGGLKKYSWISYLVVPLILLFRMIFVACCFYVNLFLKSELSDFSSCFNIALKSDSAFVLFGSFTLVYQLIAPATNLTELSTNPLTLLYYINIESIPKYLLYPLGLINLSEFCYWGLMIGLVRYRYKFSTSDSFFFILNSYGVGLLLMVLIFALVLM